MNSKKLLSLIAFLYCHSLLAAPSTTQHSFLCDGGIEDQMERFRLRVNKVVQYDEEKPKDRARTYTEITILDKKKLLAYVNKKPTYRSYIVVPDPELKCKGSSSANLGKVIKSFKVSFNKDEMSPFVDYPTAIYSGVGCGGDSEDVTLELNCIREVKK
jgi:hypothetical protein